MTEIALLGCSDPSTLLAENGVIMTTSPRMTSEIDLCGFPRACFLDSEWHARDMQEIFRRTWHLVGHSSEINRPGAFITFTLGLDQILIVRGNDAKLHAYDNFCRHRGHRLCTAPQGTLPNPSRIICSYHGWSYSVEDGACLTAVRMPEDFDKTPWGLNSVRIEEYQGAIFATFNSELESVQKLAACSDLGGYDVARMKVASKRTWKIGANWKVFVENSLECYHCQLNHPELSRRSNVWQPIEHWGSYLTDLTKNATFEWTGTDLGSTYLLNDPPKVCSVPLPRHDDKPGRTYNLAWNPNGAMTFLPEYGFGYSILPTGPGECEAQVWWYVHQDATEGEDYEVPALTSFVVATMNEDISLCEETQRGMRMSHYMPGPFNVTFQGGFQFHQWYRQFMGA
jgi:Rieske 2Fe-2S family protein